jgi:hypothetical protein
MGRPPIGGLIIVIFIVNELKSVRQLADIDRGYASFYFAY